MTHKTCTKSNLRKRGYSHALYEQLLTEQGGCCKICGHSVDDERGQEGRGILCFDHDHKNGSLRGLLCHGCNTGLGAFDDSPEFLRKAIRYLYESATEAAANNDTGIIV